MKNEHSIATGDWQPRHRCSDHYEGGKPIPADTHSFGQIGVGIQLVNLPSLVVLV